MNSLQSRKQLLVAESELNRAQLAADVAALKSSVGELAGRAKFLRTVAATAGTLMAGLSAFRRGKSAQGSVKHPWLQAILKGAGLVSTVWMAFRAQRDDREK